MTKIYLVTACVPYCVGVKKMVTDNLSTTGLTTVHFYVMVLILLIDPK